MTNIPVIVPVLKRPHMATRFIDNFYNHLDTSFGAWLLFVCSPGDDAEIEVLEREGMSFMVADWEPGPADYAKKINRAARVVINDFADSWIFTGADDLRFHFGWEAAFMDTHTSTGARVIGTQDLGNSAVKAGHHSTHTFVHSSYVTELGTIDEPGLIYHEGYDHCYVDNELVATAKFRNEWAFAERCVIEHMHPAWDKAEHDEVYHKAYAKNDEDRKLFLSRTKLWGIPWE